MDHTPPPFFKRGPAPVVRLAFFAALSIALLVLDARFRYTEGLRQLFAIAAYPFQRAATAPFALARRIGTFFVSQEQLRADMAELRSRLAAAASDAQRFESATAELTQLRRVIGAAERIPGPTLPAEILYTGRDPYDLKVVIDRGLRAGVRAGSLVIDADGVIGQVTRVHDFVAEVTLVTDKDQATPVQVVRNGLRAVAFGSGAGGTVELRFLSANADVQNGDRLVTSGIDGTYPPGLAVGIVQRVERDASQAFARVVCQPLAGVARGRYVLVVTGTAEPPPRPAVERDVPRARERRGARGTPESRRGAR